MLGLQPLAPRKREVAALVQPLIRRPRHLLALAQFGSDALFPDQLHDWLQLIGPQPQDLVHAIQLNECLRTFVAVITDDPADD